MVDYARLPEVMAGFDVALMPFALNEATRSISPTKTLEYLAAGLPVVSTRVPDVVADYDGLVHLVDDADDMAAACHKVVTDPLSSRASRLRAVARKHEWDVIASAMSALMSGAGDRASVGGLHA
jgi:glycosyltransferase involved in cell wall biosynthesis